MNDRALKLSKAVSIANQKGFGGLIIYSDGVCALARPSYLYYFSGLKALGPNNAMIVSKSGNAALLVEPQWDAARASRKSWVSDVRGSSDFVKDLIGIMHEFKITDSVSVMGSAQMMEDLYVSIEEEAKVEPADDIIEEIAREKTDREMDAVRKAAEIADVGAKAFLGNMRVGIRQYELAAEIGFAMHSAGAEDNFILISSGRHSYEMHAPVNKRLAEGDTVIAEITPSYEGQFIQLCLTAALGKPSPILVENYNMLVRALEESLRHIRSGAPASLISTSMNKVISDAGYAKYCKPPYMRARGHGLSPGSTAPAFTISDDTKGNLEKQQVVVVHPNQYLPETGYLACGETVLVTDAGMEHLSRTEIKLYIVEA